MNEFETALVGAGAVGAGAVGAASLSSPVTMCRAAAPEGLHRQSEHLEENQPDLLSGPDYIDPDAETQYGYSRYDDYQDYPFGPESAPTSIVTTRSDSTSVIAMAILAAAVMICAAIVVVVVMTDSPDIDVPTPVTTTVVRSTVTATPEPSSPAPRPTAAPPPVHGTADIPPAMPVSSSLNGCGPRPLSTSAPVSTQAACGCRS